MPPEPQRLLTDAINEVRYLAATTNTHRYRLIMRYFYDQHHLHQYALAPSQVLTHVQEALTDYTVADCQQDLESLVRWDNLDPNWELGLAGVRTIEDFKRCNVLYSATPDAIAIEELIIALEQQGTQVGELDGSAMTRLWDLLLRLEEVIALPASDTLRPERMREAWEELWLRFEDLSKSSNDYTGNMRQQERERLLDLDAFQLYKEALLTYLTRFAEGLASYRSRIAPCLGAWPVESLADTVAAGALATTRQFETREFLRDYYRQRIASFVSWLSPGGSADQLHAYATHAIERVLRTARRLSEARRGAISPANDLLALADQFLTCQQNLQRTEQLAAFAFGLVHPRHWQLELPEQVSDHVQNEPWQTTPLDTIIRQRRLQSLRAGEGGHAGARPTARGGGTGGDHAALSWRSAGDQPGTGPGPAGAGPRAHVGL